MLTHATQIQLLLQGIPLQHRMVTRGDFSILPIITRDHGQVSRYPESSERAKHVATHEGSVIKITL